MGYSRAAAAKTTNTEIRDENSPTLKRTAATAPQEMPGTSRGEKNSQSTQVKIVCISPKTGKLYPSTVTVPSDTPGISDVEEGASETSRRLRSEVKEIHKILQTSSGVSSSQEMVNDDRKQYEEELKRQK